MAHNPYCVETSWRLPVGLRDFGPRRTPLKKITNGGVQAKPPATPSSTRPPPFNPEARLTPSRPPLSNPNARRQPLPRGRTPLPSGPSSRLSPPPPKYTVEPPSDKALDMPPRYADLPFVQDYRDPFYDTHVLYEALGLYRDQPYQEIFNNRLQKLNEVYQKTKNDQSTNAWGDYIVLMVASRAFTSKLSKTKYDSNGDPKLSDSSLMQEDELSEWYKNHRFYVAVGAHRYDDSERIWDALKTTAYRILQETRKSGLHHTSMTKMVWYNACYMLMDEKRRDEYVDRGDQDLMLISE